MSDEFTLTLNSPITEEQWDMITDVDFDNTNEITFYTKHGKEVKFVKASAHPEPCEDAVSRQDAIIQLSHNKNGDPDCDVIIQHDIETLKQLPSVTPKPQIGELVVRECEDTVSREAVIEEIKVCFNMGGCDCGQCNSIIEHINSLPPVTLKRRKDGGSKQ